MLQLAILPLAPLADIPSLQVRIAVDGVFISQTLTVSTAIPVVAGVCAVSNSTGGYSGSICQSCQIAGCLPYDQVFLSIRNQYTASGLPTTIEVPHMQGELQVDPNAVPFLYPLQFFTYSGTPVALGGTYPYRVQWGLYDVRGLPSIDILFNTAQLTQLSSEYSSLNPVDASTVEPIVVQQGSSGVRMLLPIPQVLDWGRGERGKGEVYEECGGLFKQEREVFLGGGSGFCSFYR